MSEKIPVYGSITRPGSPEEGAIALKEESFDAPKNALVITYESDEFTSNCPKTGQPDFNKVTIEYLTKDKCIESKAMKFYLWAFREWGGYAETVADRIAQDVFDAIDPVWVCVTLHQNKRGGVALTARAERHQKYE